jgi:hypothetical protein
MGFFLAFFQKKIQPLIMKHVFVDTVMTVFLVAVLVSAGFCKWTLLCSLFIINSLERKL